VITVVGRDGAGLVQPVDGETEPLAVFTSMGNPAFVVAIHEAYAAQVQPTNAPPACSPTFLIGESIGVATLQDVAESLRSADAPPSVHLEWSGARVRGATVTIRATGVDWPTTNPIEVELANPDGFGAMGLALARRSDDGALTATFSIPGVLSYEGTCKGSGSCDRISTKVGPMRVRFIETDGGRRVVGEGSFDVVAAKRNRPYPTAMYGECGPPRVELDGATWVAAEPVTTIHDRIEGTITIRSATGARFVDTTTGEATGLRKSPTPYSC
jgi:hypothetical protein